MFFSDSEAEPGSGDEAVDSDAKEEPSAADEIQEGTSDVEEAEMLE